MIDKPHMRRDDDGFGWFCYTPGDSFAHGWGATQQQAYVEWSIAAFFGWLFAGCPE